MIPKIQNKLDDFRKAWNIGHFVSKKGIPVRQFQSKKLQTHPPLFPCSAEQLIADYPGELDIVKPWFDLLSNNEKNLRFTANKKQHFGESANDYVAEFVSYIVW